MTGPLAIGIDVGTSGVRAAAVDARGSTTATARKLFSDYDGSPNSPEAWWRLTQHALFDLLSKIDREAVEFIIIDGTSGTLLAVDEHGAPLGSPMMYNEAVSDPAVLDSVRRNAPLQSAAHGPTSGLAKAIVLQAQPRVSHLLHQADWISGCLSGRYDVTDENNALKTGYDIVARRWPDWIDHTGLKMALLPIVAPAGSPIGPVRSLIADLFGLSRATQVLAGTTDGCASFLATGADQLGDGVTALGSSLTLKMLSDRPVFSPQSGVYSHRLGPYWLAGGASNSGGKVLAAFFSPERIGALSNEIDPARLARLDLYPLLSPGERFPTADPLLPPRLEPRPANDADFLHELLAGITAIESAGYSSLAALGAPPLRTIRSVGGGARNPTWTAMRRNRLGVPFLAARSEEAAAGVAQLARWRMNEQPR